MYPDPARFLCGFPERLHPISQQFLDYFIEGRMATADFLRFFSLPNSDYIALGACFVKLFIQGSPTI